MDLGIGHPSAFVAKDLFNLCKPIVGPNDICQIQNKNAFNNRSFTLQGPNTPAAVSIYMLRCQMDGHQHGANCVGVCPALVLLVQPGLVWRRM